MQELIEFARSIWGLWLMLLFLGIVAWPLWPSRKAELEAQKMSPFGKDEG